VIDVAQAFVAAPVVSMWVSPTLTLRTRFERLSAAILADAKNAQFVAVQIAEIPGVEAFPAGTGRTFVFAAKFERPLVHPVDLS